MDKFFLLVDDDPDDADFFKEALTEAKPEIGFYHIDNGTDMFPFLDKPHYRKPDIIFLDINMHKITGWQCLTRLKDHPEHRDIPVIMYSTSSAERDASIALQLGAMGLLSKPTDFKALVSALAAIAKTEYEDLKRVLRDLLQGD